jgi:hypothetical protein
MSRTRIVSFITPSQTHVHYTMKIPSCIDPEYWIYHELSENDIRHIISHIPSWLMWITAVMFDKLVTWAMVKYSFSDIYGIMVNNKVLAMKHLQQKCSLVNNHNNKIDLLSYTIYKHTPPLPKYCIDVTTFDFLVTKIVPNLLPQIFQKEPTIIPHCEFFKNKLWVPTVCDGNMYICMVSIFYVTNENNTIQTPGPGYTHLSQVGLYKGNLVSLTDEYIWFCK